MLFAKYRIDRKYFTCINMAIQRSYKYFSQLDFQAEYYRTTAPCDAEKGNSMETPQK